VDLARLNAIVELALPGSVVALARLHAVVALARLHAVVALARLSAVVKLARLGAVVWSPVVTYFSIQGVAPCRARGSLLSYSILCACEYGSNE
jgi:hypothetical protein